MADSYIGEVRVFGFNYAPLDWAFCDGAQVQVQQFQGLYAVLGNVFGGTQNTNFNLPQLGAYAVQGIDPTGSVGSQVKMGQATGTQTVTLNSTQMAPHTHPMYVYIPKGGTSQYSTVMEATPENGSRLFDMLVPNSTGALSNVGLWGPNTNATTLAPQAIGASGSGTAHENRQPFLVMNYCISLEGTFPVPAD